METSEIIKKLSEDISKEAIQKTDKRETKKGYDTTGYGYQWCVDRFNEVLGDSWGYEWEIIKETEGHYKSGAPYFDICIKLGIAIQNKDNMRYCVGGHTAINYSDALKGAITNAFKKTAAFWGVGAKAFRGELDDDAILPESDNEKTSQPKLNEKTNKTPRQLIIDDIVEILKSDVFNERDRKNAKIIILKTSTNEELIILKIEYELEIILKSGYFEDEKADYKKELSLLKNNKAKLEAFQKVLDRAKSVFEEKKAAEKELPATEQPDIF